MKWSDSNDFYFQKFYTFCTFISVLKYILLVLLFKQSLNLIKKMKSNVT